MNIFFENQYTRNKDYHKEIITYSYLKTPMSVVVYIIVALFFIPFVISLFFPSVLPFENSSKFYVLFLLIGPAVRITSYFKALEIGYKRDLENNNGEAIEIKIIATNDGIESCRVNSESNNHFSYKSIRKIIKTHNYFLLLTEAKQYIVFKKDGFIKGTPEEFLPFIKSKVTKKAKKSKTQTVFICLACVFAILIAASLYMVNGRTIFNNRAEPSEAELEKINEIISFEQEKLSECVELLSRYDEKIKELGIEIRPELDQTRAVNSQGLVEKHDWNKDMWLPKYYSSKIIYYVYKDGKKLEHRTSPNSLSYFVDIFWLLHSGKNETTTFNENPFDRFDSGLDNLLERVSIYLKNQ